MLLILTTFVIVAVTVIAAQLAIIATILGRILTKMDISGHGKM